MGSFNKQFGQAENLKAYCRYRKDCEAYWHLEPKIKHSSLKHNLKKKSYWSTVSKEQVVANRNKSIGDTNVRISRHGIKD